MAKGRVGNGAADCPERSLALWRLLGTDVVPEGAGLANHS
jgi:hypothetical protein